MWKALSEASNSGPWQLDVFQQNQACWKVYILDLLRFAPPSQPWTISDPYYMMWLCRSRQSGDEKGQTNWGVIGGLKPRGLWNERIWQANAKPAGREFGRTLHAGQEISLRNGDGINCVRPISGGLLFEKAENIRDDWIFYLLIRRYKETPEH